MTSITQGLHSTSKLSTLYYVTLSVYAVCAIGLVKNKMQFSAKLSTLYFESTV